MTLPSGAETITWEGLAAALTVLGGLGAVALWLLGTRFATRTQIAALHRKIDEERRQTDATIGFHDKRVTECEQQQQLAAKDSEQVAKDIADIKDMLRTRLDKDEVQLASHGERLAAIEAHRPR